MNPTESNNTTRRESLLDSLRSIMREALPAVQSDDDIHVPFLEMGANSLVLMEIQRTVENTFGLNIVINQFFEELTTIDALATYIDQNLPAEVSEPEVSEPLSVNSELVSAEAGEPVAALSHQVVAKAVPNLELNLGEASSELEQIFTQQLQAASQAVSQVVSQQLAFLRESGLSSGTLSDADTTSAAKTTPAVSPPSKPAVAPKPVAKKPKSAVSPQHLLSPLEIRARGLTEKQQRHLEALIARYTERTKTSKKMTQDSRSVLADSRATVGFRFTTKEMLYPIVGKRAMGARLWDVDDNEYIDISMGQGVNLFGHNPSFVTNALETAISARIQPEPPRSQQVGEVAELIAELTGMDRVTFTNSGTEAVMAALRLARAATGRYKIVIFENAYHGHADYTMVRAEWQEGIPQAVPIARGTPPSAVSDMWVLEYGTEQSLEFIRAHAHELAAVMVEPVQSRRPDFQPKEFLQQLRQITREAGTLLIFDEMITGFRVHPGGAQAVFGVKADIATYGKLIGGGLPIGVVAGKAEYMDSIDGGMWQYGDASYPQTERVAFGGTFCQHPLTMSTSLATLKYLKAHSPALQENLNRRTTQLAKTLNRYFEQEEVPIQIVYFGSQFRFAFSSNLELLFYHLMEKGVFIWEWRNYFMSTAHTDEDIDYVIKAVKESVEEMREGEFLPPKSSGVETFKLPKDSKKKAEEIIAPISPQPMNEAQKQLWVLAQITSAGSIAYHTSVTLQLEGLFHLTAMRQAVQQVVDRHEALRTIIKEDFQHILPSRVIEVPLVDFSCVENRDAEVEAWFKKESQTPFDFSQESLFRVHILKLEEQRHLLVLTAHHILVDGLSINILIQEIGAFYTCICQEQDCQLEPPIQFREYVQWQAQRSTTKEMAAHETYWLNKFSDTIPVIDLPTDRPPPSLTSYQGSRLSVPLATSLCSELKRLSRQQGCTPFMSFLSVYTLFMHRITGQDDIVIGFPTAGRSLKGNDKLVGYCTHLLPIRSQIEEHQSFLAYLKAMRRVLLEAYQHADYPFSNLINKLDILRDGSQSPLVSVVFNLDQPSEVPSMFELEGTWLPRTLQFTDFDLSFNLIEIGDEFVLECDYNTDLFETTTMERFVGHFQTLLAGIVAHPEQGVFELPLLSEPERHQLLVEWNDTQTDYPKDKCVHQLFEAQVEKTPEAIAVVFENQQLTYQALNTKANQLAYYLQSIGVKPDVLVGICLERSLEMVIGLFGILKAGGAYLPLDPAYPAARLAFMLEDAQVSVLLTQTSLIDELPNTTAQVVCLDAEVTTLSQLSVNNPSSGVVPSSLAYVIYTSGSTGKPKGVMIQHQSLVNFINTAIIEYRLTRHDSLLQFASISFDAAAEEIYPCLVCGGRLVLRFDEMLNSVSFFLQQCRDFGLTVLDLPTTFWHQMTSELAKGNVILPDSLRLVIIGGERALSEQVGLWQQWVGATPRLVNTYGPTEATVVATMYQLPSSVVLERDWRNIPIGRAIHNIQTYILDKYLQPVPIGVPGELYLGGVGLARGYLNRPELTAEKFLKNAFSDDPNARLYKTGDRVCYLPDGNIEYLGRIDNQVKIRGFRIELGEIEAVLNQHPNVSENVVQVMESASGDKRLIAYLVPTQESPGTQELRQFIKDQLPDYMIPFAFVQIEAMPLSPNGKIDYRALKALNISGQLTEETFVAPRTEDEKLLSDIWGSVLEVERVGIYDNFFELGGHSLLATQVMSRIRDTFSCELPLRQLFESPTVADMAKHIELVIKMTQDEPTTDSTDWEETEL